MLNKSSIRRYLRQITAFIEKNLYLQLRIRTEFFNRFVYPLIELLIFIFIFGILFNIEKGIVFGYWNSNNYVLFILLAFSVQFSKPIITRYRLLFMKEKYWKTLSAIMIAPVNRFTLLISVLVSELVVVSIPISILLIIALILFPINIFYIFLVFLIFMAIFLIFAAIGLILGVFAISNEEYITYLNLVLRFTFMVSCTNYPKEIFPEIIQNVVILNPFYYLFDLLRLTWYLGVNREEAINFITPLHIIVVISLTLIFPIFSLYFFNTIYKKHGITGY